MPHPCTICTHPQRTEIERLLLSGQPNRRVASQFDVTEASIRRHRVGHLSQKLVKAQAAQEVLEADTLLNEVRTGKTRAESERILERALDASDFRTALQAIRSAVEVMREARALTELKGELTGELNQQPNQGGGIILLPTMVPVGTISPLNVQLDPEAVWQAPAEREKKMGIVEAQVITPAKALPPAAAPRPRPALPPPALPPPASGEALGSSPVPPRG